MKIFQDSGKDWIKNSTFGPLRTANQNYTSDSLNIDSRIGLNLYNKARAFYGFGHFTYKNNFHGFLYSRIVTHANFFERYSGIERDISRLGFTSEKQINLVYAMKITGLLSNLGEVEKVGEQVMIYN